MKMDVFEILKREVEIYIIKGYSKIEAYILALKKFDIHLFSDENLESIRNDLSKLISEDDKSKDDNITWLLLKLLALLAFLMYVYAIIDLFILKNMLQIISIIICPLLANKFMIKPFMEYYKGKKNLKINKEEAAKMKLEISRELQRRLDVRTAVDVPYQEVLDKSEELYIDIDVLLDAVNSKIDRVPNKFRDSYSERLALLSGDITGDSGVIKSLIDLNIELQELLNNIDTDYTKNDNYGRERRKNM